MQNGCLTDSKDVNKNHAACKSAAGMTTDSTSTTGIALIGPAQHLSGFVRYRWSRRKFLPALFAPATLQVCVFILDIRNGETLKNTFAHNLVLHDLASHNVSEGSSKACA